MKKYTYGTYMIACTGYQHRNWYKIIHVLKSFYHLYLAILYLNVLCAVRIRQVCINTGMYFFDFVCTVHRNQLYKQTNKMRFLYVFILQFLYKSTCFERPFRSSWGVHDLLYSAALYISCWKVKTIAVNMYWYVLWFMRNWVAAFLVFLHCVLLPFTFIFM